MSSRPSEQAQALWPASAGFLEEADLEEQGWEEGMWQGKGGSGGGDEADVPGGRDRGNSLARVEHRGTHGGRSLRRAPVGIPDPQLDLGGHRVGEGGACGCRMTLACSLLRKWLRPSLGSSGPDPQTHPSPLHFLHPPSPTVYP